MSANIYLMKLVPALHTRVWGGRNLESMFGKSLPDDSPYGESWEMHDSCTVANGHFAGMTLGDLVRAHGQEMIGAQYNPADGLPLLIKILDAEDWLSVQVHPNDEQARQLEGDPRGKTEAWIILGAKPQARLVVGVRPGTTREAMAEAIRSGTLESMLIYAEVKAGDVFYMPANTIHAIGPGIQIYEVQQSSDITYRLYDWNRMGLDGKPRPLHIEKGVRVSNIDSLPHITHPREELMLSGPYFATHRHIIHGRPVTIPTSGHFQGITCISGSIELAHESGTITLATGETAFVPAALDQLSMSGDGTVLRSVMGK